MSDIITPKGFGKQMEKTMLRDMVQFWHDRQNRHHDQYSDQLDDKVRQLLDRFKNGVIDREELIQQLEIVEDERIGAKASNDSQLYREAFTDGIKFILQALIIE